MTERAKFTELTGCVGDSERIVVDGFVITARVEYDHDSGRPWKECDGYGIVSEWTTRDKRPGERVLCEDRGSKRYYDWQASIEKAKAESWDAEPYGTGTKGEQAVRAVEADFRNLKAWCDDEWCWVGVVLEVSIELGDTEIEINDHAGSLYGLSSDDDDHVRYVANDLIDEALESSRKIVQQLAAKLCTVSQ